MGPPRTAAARLKRAQSGRIRRWIATVGVRARTLLRSAEAAETVLREVLEFFGETNTDEVSMNRGVALLRANWDRYCSGAEPGEEELMANVAILAELLGLDEAEEEVLALFAAIPTNPALQQTLERIDARSRHQATRVLAVVLGHNNERIRAALSAESPLAKYQILNVSGAAFDFSQFGLLNDDVERALSSSRPDLRELLSAFFVAAPASGLRREDFSHLEPKLATLLAYLRGADEAAAKGANVLLHGWPGTGKTELSRLIVEELGWAGFEVRTSNRDGSASSGDDRIGSYLLAQRFLQQSRRHLVIFDEVEDLFSTEYGFGRARLGKLFMNRLLEQNQVPAIWICNDVSSLSPAVRRRFDFSIAFGPLPRHTRRSVLERHLGGVDRGVVAELLGRDSLLPSQISTARKVATLAAGGKRENDVLVETIDASMRLLEQPIPVAEEVLEFDLALCNADVDLDRAVAGLLTKQGRRVVALYGPPGTGKSALARYLAQRLDSKAVLIGASDVLSAFLGETEQRVARIFESVDVDGEVIVLEEADELLGARTTARQSWEIRLVNEILTRMDAFTGVMVLTTNAIDRLDAAAIRRFGLKIKLDYMRPEQRLAMWQRRVGGEAAGAFRDRLLAMDRLTAGDFAAVTAQSTIVGANWMAEEWIHALEKELSLRPQPPRRAGFVA